MEQRFRVADSAVFADATTLTSTGAVDSFPTLYQPRRDDDVVQRGSARSRQAALDQPARHADSR